jgi:hypothetical protein
VGVGSIGKGVDVDGAGVGAVAHALIIVKNMNIGKIDPICLFMTFSPFVLIVQESRLTVCVTRWWAG